MWIFINADDVIADVWQTEPYVGGEPDSVRCMGVCCDGTEDA